MFRRREQADSASTPSNDFSMYEDKRLKTHRH